MQTTSSRLPIAASRIPASFPLPVTDRNVFSPSELPNRTSPLNRDALVERLWRELPISRKKKLSPDTISDLLRLYSDSHRRLERAVTEIDRLFSVIARVGLEIREFSGDDSWRRTAFQKKHAERRKKLSWDFSLDSLSFTELLADEPVLSTAVIRVENRLRSETEKFVDALIAKFDQLARENVFGRVAWQSESECRFQFFGEVALREKPVPLTRVKETTVDEGLTELVTRETVKLLQHTITHRSASHVHRLTDAREIPLSDRSLDVPVLFRELVDEIPAWLHDQGKFIVGTCVGERIIERDVQKEIEEREIERKSSSLRFSRIPLPKTDWELEFDRELVDAFYRDPAIAIGPYILSGWGEREIQAVEQERRRESELAERKAAVNAEIERTKQSRWLGVSAIAGGAFLAGLGVLFSTFTVVLGLGLLGVGGDASRVFCNHSAAYG